MDSEMTMSAPDGAWVAADWGTSNLRVWLVDQDGRILQHGASGDGMSALEPHTFEAALLSLVDKWFSKEQAIRVIACGMVGAKQGWIEAPYRHAPCSFVHNEPMMAAPCKDPRLSVHIAPGICQLDPADVMRGEETQLLGWLTAHKAESGLVCMPGTHAKWVQVEQGRLSHFRTMMTGEVFALLRQHSVLRHSLGSDTQDKPSFLEGVRQGFDQPEKTFARLFSIRARGLVGVFTPAQASSYLSGLLIGSDIASNEALHDHPEGVTLIGQGALCEAYQTALDCIDVRSRIVDGTDAVLAGLVSYRQRQR